MSDSSEGGRGYSIISESQDTFDFELVLGADLSEVLPSENLLAFLELKSL